MHRATDMADRKNPFVITCEHASNQVPIDGLVLGVSDDALRSQAAWDPGARDVAIALASAFDCPLELGRYTRLLVDLNRSPENLAEAVPAVCYGVAVPANQGLSDAQRRARLEAYHAPYRAAVDAHVTRTLDTVGRCILVSVHSFSPALDPDNRRFDVGLMYDVDRTWETALADRIDEALARHGRSSSRNRPYDGKADSILSPFRARYGSPAFLGIELELNQALMEHDWVAPLSEALLEGLR